MDEGLPRHCSLTPSELPAEVRISKSRMSQIKMTVAMNGIELKIKGMLGSTKSWKSIEHMRKVLWFKKTKISEYAAEHWKEDDFYGYQFLNGINPHVIRRCSELPPNFPVTQEMVKPFLEAGSSLQEEMKKGRIFLYDQKIMDGIPGRIYKGEHLQVTPGFCLLYLNSENKLMPIAIQLNQRPSAENPIFLPNDTEADWLLAKMFIRNADYMDHQAIRHLMNTHFLGEVFAMATIRCFPVIHPIYKLLIPHFNYTLHISGEARRIILGADSGVSQYTLGYDGALEFMRRSHAKTTYGSLCLPDNITARGLESIPNFYYRDDGLKLWTLISSFVGAVVQHYYPSDSDILRDTELQEWISEIFIQGFLGNESSGFPSCFRTAEEAIKFITMVIFTVSAQHSAVNTGQFDYQAFVPNGSLLLRRPPPVSKGVSSVETMLETLPNFDEVAKRVAISSVLSEKYIDFVPLGSYPDERFHEAAPKQMIKEFQAELSYLSEVIKLRNSKLEVPYTYLDPAEIENSVTI